MQVAAYYFPNYHADARNEQLHGKGWTEWDLVRRAEPRFPGHAQPKVPVWGYDDEADPEQMARRIDAAADHGIDSFIFDWYYYNDGPFLERALDDGFLNAPNNDRMKFALMWANHDWIDIHPAKIAEKSVEKTANLLYPGAVTEATFDKIIKLCIERYFKHPSYWSLDGCPYFSVYEITKLMEGLGSVEATRRCLARFRDATKAAGFPDLHLNAILWNNPILPGEAAVDDAFKLVEDLGFSSVNSYIWIHHAKLNQFPVSDYADTEDQYFKYWDEVSAGCKLPYYPNLTMGWDPSPRTVQSDQFINRGYPFCPTISGNTPSAFEAAAQRIQKRLLAENPTTPFVSINAWNEWTEGSYLEPDTQNGNAYLDAIRNTFSDK